MLAKPIHGWTNLTIGDIVIPSISYVCSPQHDLCDAFAEYFSPAVDAVGTACLEHEGSTTIIVLSLLGISILQTDGPARTYDVSHEQMVKYAHELVSDVERDFDVWIDEWEYPEKDEREEHASALRDTIANLKSKIPY